MSNKKWKFKRWGKESTVEYCGDYILHKGHVERKISLENFVGNSSVDTNLNIDNELMDLIVAEHKLPESWPISTQYYWQFWQALDRTKIFKRDYNITSNWGNKVFHLKENGSYQSQDVGYKETRDFSNVQKLQDLFFNGPKSVGLSLEARTQIRKIIWHAIDKDKVSFRLEDAFPLFDYDKINRGYWEKVDGIQGDYISISKGVGRVELGGWSNPRDGGCNFVSVESFWANPQSHLMSQFYPIIPQIRAILEKALLDKQGHPAPELD